MRSDLVATVSHELRTPLAAIYGAAVTVRRPDLDIGEETRDRLLEIVEHESNRLAEIVHDLLLAGHPDPRRLHPPLQTADPKDVPTSVVAAPRLHLPEGGTPALPRPKRLS